jgi:hypothetical protein
MTMKPSLVVKKSPLLSSLLLLLLLLLYEIQSHSGVTLALESDGLDALLMLAAAVLIPSDEE